MHTQIYIILQPVRFWTSCLLPQFQNITKILQTTSTNPQFFCCIKANNNSRIVQFGDRMQSQGLMVAALGCTFGI